ncbi:MBL fold metallo-hydrolase [Piscinibacter sp.]|uniref:MBL fold metallo-hydrolase n=1 Tax=Piscinibacter sp. TaxID=1903157 RepID=UPI0039E23EDC
MAAAIVKTLPALLLALALHGAACAQDTPVPEPVAPGAWMVQGQSALGSAANRNFISNAGFVVTNEGVVVIDALGSPALAEELIARIRRITPQPVTHVIVTHYHADHIYGLQAFKAAGATVIAQRAAGEYLNSETAAQRLKASREELFPWIDENTRLVPADRWIDGPTTLTVGGVEFRLIPVGPAHTPEDLVVLVPRLRVLFAGDLVFRGRVPFVGQADSGHWIEALDALLAHDIDVVVPGHGPASTSARADLQLTRDYLAHLRRTMGEAARNMEPFEEAYEKADWSRFDKLPLFKAANRINAYNTYLLMEHEAK